MVVCILADYAELSDAASNYEGAVPTLLHLLVWDVSAALDAGCYTVAAIVTYLQAPKAGAAVYSESGR